MYVPRTVFQKILLGARKWNGPRAGFTLHLFLRKDINFNLFLKIEKYMFNIYYLNIKTRLHKIS